MSMPLSRRAALATLVGSSFAPVWAQSAHLPADLAGSELAVRGHWPCRTRDESCMWGSVCV